MNGVDGRLQQKLLTAEVAKECRRVRKAQAEIQIILTERWEEQRSKISISHA